MSKLIKLIKNYFFCLKYPFWRYRAIKSFDDQGNYKLKTDYSICWYDDISKGWRKAFGKQLSDEILKAGKKYLKEHKKEHLTWDDIICWQQIKEKWGTLNLYASACDPIYKILEKYEDLSSSYCQYCGKPSKYMTQGWITYLCEDCYLDKYKDRYDYDSPELLEMMKRDKLED